VARPKYPSDERRVKGPMVRVACAIRNADPDHPEHSEVFEDATLRGVWVGLLTVAWQAFAGRTDDRVTLSVGDRIWIGGVPNRGRNGRRIASRVTEAESKLRLVCHRMDYSVTEVGDNWIVHVKNLQQNQGITPRTTADATPPSESESEVRSPSTNPREEIREESSAAAAAPPLDLFPSDAAPQVKPKRTPPERIEPPEAIEFADAFAAAVQGVNPAARPPTPTARGEWIRETRLMLERDQRPLAELRAVADWLFNSADSDAMFWRKNVLSVPKFRQQYVRLYAAKRSAVHVKQQSTREGPAQRAVRNIVERDRLRRAAGGR
jgi:hypothetical protein